MDKRVTAIGGLFGLSAVSVFVVLYLHAMAGDPGYTFFEDYLSDLGVGPRAWAFNAAAITAGALGIPFVLLGLFPYLEGGISSSLAGLLGVIGCVMLVLVGLFPEDTDPHYTVSVAFFTSMLAAVGVAAYSLHVHTGRRGAATQLTEGAFAAGVVIMVFGFRPWVETLAVIDILVWVAGLSAILIIQRSRAPTT